MSACPLVKGPVPSNCTGGVPVCLGIDEAGRGPVLGDMVYGAAYWPIAENDALAKLGFMDSKVLTPARREDVFNRLKDSWKIGWIVHPISAADISAKMLNSAPHSLNVISHESAVGLVRAAVADGVNVEEVYVDTVGTAERYEEYLTKAFDGRIRFTVTKKADSLFPVVSAASICAKVTRDKGIEGWVHKEAGFVSTGPLGSGYPADPLTKTWLAKNMEPVFGYPDIVRFSWQTTETLLEKDAVGVIWDGEEEASGGIASFFGTKPDPTKRCAYVKKMKLERVTQL